MLAVATTLGPSRASNAQVDAAAVTRRVDEHASLRVDSRKLDSLLDAVGELIIVQSLIQDDPALSARPESRLAVNLGQLKRVTADLQRSAMALRKASMRQAFQMISRVVHDLSRKADKSVELVLAGEDIELDRKMVQELTDPIMHIVRNSIDHGIEMADVRVAAGKRPRARVSLSVCHQGGQIVIEIADDGRGLDTDKIKARAIECGLITAHASPSQDEIHRLIFERGSRPPTRSPRFRGAASAWTSSAATSTPWAVAS